VGDRARSLPFERLGAYRVLEVLGRGGMGAVYRAVDERTSTPVALKVVLPELASDEAFLERFRREGRLAAAVRHENVVALLDSGESRGSLYLVLEFVPGGSLKARLKTGPLPWREVASLGAGIARGLASLHAAGLVHRDLKPDNVLLDERGHPKIADLGLARRADGAVSQALTKTGELVGTFEYMAPEQANAAGNVDARADLYALGATLYALLAGRPPFVGSGLGLVKKHLFEAPAPLRSIEIELPRELDALVLRLLSKDPGARGESAEEVARELDAIARAEGPSARGSRRWLAVAAVVVAVLALGLAAFLSSSGAVVPEVGESPRPSARPSAPKPSPSGPPPWVETYRREGRLPARLPDGLAYGKGDGEYVNAKDGSVLIYVPGGTFKMGIDTPGDTVAHRVTLSPYFIGKFELTNEKFAGWVKKKQEAHPGWQTHAERLGTPGHRLYYTGSRADPILATPLIDGASWRHPFGKGSDARDDDPVVDVAWQDAEEYCADNGLRLPTEAEWEFAARQDDPPSSYPWEGEWSPTLANFPDDHFYEKYREKYRDSDGDQLEHFSGDDGYAEVAPVGSFPRDKSRWGVFDLGGNVSEWCSDYFDAYSARSEIDPKGPRVARKRFEEERVYRGGSWSRQCGTFSRGFAATAAGEEASVGGRPFSYDDLGIRVARSAGDRP
jgi:serine/threonine-protein kinase